MDILYQMTKAEIIEWLKSTAGKMKTSQSNNGRINENEKNYGNNKCRWSQTV